ncbi:helix-turn-helix domain-containing protein [Thiocapsa roseopersicina]|uniref:Homeodomain-like domain-containing protein n=1 Tax=Thiocapsa roseopersicina TaxID=1058 RepID=A0A1H3CK93_THIRO|nr:Homeodomain-like domain-containing protein [Thiocapsa roseopersicina]
MMAMFILTGLDAFAMARCTAAPIDLTNKPCCRLKAIVRQHSAPQSLVMRARIILLGADGAGVRETAERLSLGRATVQRWRARRTAPAGQPFRERLADAPRPGTPATFTPEQICAIIALACENPSVAGLPITHWTHAALAEEAIARHRHGDLLPLDRARPARGRSEAASHPRLDQQPARYAVRGERPRCLRDRPLGARACSRGDSDAQHRRHDRGAGPQAGGATRVRIHPPRHLDPDRILRFRHRPGHRSPRADPHRGGFRRVARRAARQPPRTGT